MRLLIIGGTGTISTAVVQEALNQGHQVSVLNRGSSPLPQGVEQLTGDIRDEAAIARLLEGRWFDAVGDFLTYLPDQARQAIRLFAGKTAQYLFISSATVYEKPPRRLFMREDMPRKNPYSQYARDKIACEDVFMQAWQEKDFPVTVVRPSYTYGEKTIPFIFNSRESRYAIIERMKQGKPIVVPGDGTIFWTITHNSDFARAFVGLCGRSQAIGQSFHITGDTPMTWNMFLDAIADAWGLKAKAVHVATDTVVKYFPYEEAGLLGDKSQTAVFDNSKVKELVPGFQCRVSFEEGIRRCRDWFESHPELCHGDPAWDAQVDNMLRELNL